MLAKPVTALLVRPVKALIRDEIKFVRVVKVVDKPLKFRRLIRSTRLPTPVTKFGEVLPLTTTENSGLLFRKNATVAIAIAVPIATPIGINKAKRIVFKRRPWS